MLKEVSLCTVLQLFLIAFRYLIMSHEELHIVDDFGSCSVQVLEQRVETLERELDASITAAAHARSEKRQAEAAQKAAELRTQEITKELENTSSM